MAVVQGRKNVSPSAVPKPSDLVEESWRRCLGEYRLDPTGLPHIDVANAHETKIRAQALSGLLPTALTAIPELSRALRDCPHLILLADAEGVILHRLGDLCSSDTARKAEVSPGAVWDERRQGTNGLGTSLACGGTASVHLTDHFAPGNAWLSCVSTPLRNPSGTVVCALNVTFPQGRGVPCNSVVEYLLETAGRRIEDLFMMSEHSESWIVGLNTRHDIAGIGFEAALAVGPDERVLGCNSAARRLFGSRGLSPLGQTLHKMFGRSLEELLAGRSSPLASVEFGGQRLYAHIRPPLRGLALPKTRPIPSAARKTGPIGLAEIAGADDCLSDSLARLRRFIDRKLPILIGGETGTGKDVLARALHDESARRSKPFVAINCAALPEALIESELFGYADGAFTGANRRGYQGKIVQSSGGTLFLDEIGDMPLPLQTRLLRVLTQEEVCPLGSDRVVAVDLNVISASHRNLEQLVEAGRFRADLLYRLRGVQITLPAVRDRSDLAELLRTVWESECLALDIHPALDETALERLLSYSWPGNLRELRSALKAIIISDLDGVVTTNDLPDYLVCGGGPTRAAGGVAQPSERAQLVEALRRSGWHVTTAAHDLGRSRQAIYRAMQKHGIRPPNYEDWQKL